MLSCAMSVSPYSKSVFQEGHEVLPCGWSDSSDPDGGLTANVEGSHSHGQCCHVLRLPVLRLRHSSLPPVVHGSCHRITLQSQRRVN